MGKYTFIDLFSGCGGFSTGLKRAGLHCVAAIDNDPVAIETYKKNFPGTKNVLVRDLTKFRPQHLQELLPKKVAVDLIVGGPPCQGFSLVRQVDGANHGERLVYDPRRNLFREYLRYVKHFRPRMFVMENVPGIKSAAGGAFFTRVQVQARSLGYRVHWEEVRAWRFGVPQKRIRHLVIGTRADLPVFSGLQFLHYTHGDPEGNGQLLRRTRDSGSGEKLKAPVTLWEAIGDLPPLAADSGKYETKYDLKRRKRHVATYGTWYNRHVLQAGQAKLLTSHVSRVHSKRDLRDFARLREGETSAGAIARGVRMEFPYGRDHFKDRYTKQHRNRLCSTILAHMSKDGLMFIHPTQNRSLTPREAARVQSFPDWFIFPESKTDTYRLIGNAVPPLVGEAVGHALRKYVQYSNRLSRAPMTGNAVPKRAIRKVVSDVIPLMDAANLENLSSLADDKFKKGWLSISFIHGHLHPDSAQENGSQKKTVKGMAALPAESPRGLTSPVYARSGWPVNVVPIAREARRRVQEGRLSLKQYYSSPARIAGVRWAKRSQAG